jgi:RND family efflux transporter MFP subunit
MKNLRLLIFPLIITLLFVFYFWDSFKGRKVICAKLEIGTIRDTVSGNVQVLAEKTFLLKSSVQGVVSQVAMQPMGKSILVDFNQTILQFDITDLNRSLKQALMAKSHFMQRIEKGSAIALQLEIEEEDLESLISLSKADKISHSELDRKRNLVERLRTQLEHEKISNNEALINHSVNIENLQSQISGMTLNSPIKGQLIMSNANQGDVIFPGHHIGTIISSSRIIEASLNEEDFSGLSEGLPAGITLFSLGSSIFDANVTRFSTTVNPSTGRRIVYLEITDKTISLPPGASGRVEIIKSERKDRKLIPRKALIGNSVFIVKNGRAKIRDVVVGAKNLETVEILEGIDGDEIVVIETPHILRDGQSIQPILVKNKN